jgi:uncharacterized cofD-like protein
VISAVSELGPAVVALGGGHGLAASLTALRSLTDRLTAVVTVADDGGSSGRLRREFDILPPGDLRMALAALCGDDDWGRTWADVVQHRFAGDGPLAGHAMGNLMIAAIWERLGDPVAGLDLVARLLGARGRVLPMATVPLTISAELIPDPADPVVVRVVGQAAVATAPGTVVRVALEPADPPACAEAVAAVDAADIVVLGPGSWFSSVVPHLLVPDLAAALSRTSATRIVLLNLVPGHGETEGYTPTELLEVLHSYAPSMPLDLVLADPDSVGDPSSLRAACDVVGAELVLAPLAAVAEAGAPDQHDPHRLAVALDALGGRGKMPRWR